MAIIVVLVVDHHVLLDGMGDGSSAELLMMSLGVPVPVMENGDTTHSPEGIHVHMLMTMTMNVTSAAGTIGNFNDATPDV